MTTADGSADTHRAPRPSWRRRAELLLPTLAVAAAVATPLAVWSRLPEPMAVHWSLSGVPDGAAPRLLDVLLLGAVTAALGFGPLVAARTAMPRWSARVLIATSSGGSALFLVLRGASLQANLDAASWQAAGSFGIRHLGVALLAAASGAAVGAWLAADRPDHATVTAEVAPAEVRPGEAVVWTGRAANRAGTFSALALLLAAAVAVWLVPAPGRNVVLLVLPLAAVAMSSLAQVTVTVGPRAVVARLGWFGWPRLRVPIGEVEGVHLETVEPTSYGGWGLRWTPTATGVVIRRGPGIRIDRRGTRALVVTVDDAEVGAAVLLAHLQAAGGGRSAAAPLGE